MNKLQKIKGGLINRKRGLLLVALLLLVSNQMYAQSDATAITTAATSAFGGVATLCVTIGTFFAVYKLVKKIR